MSLEKQIQTWLHSEEFQAFYQKAEYTMALTIEGQGTNTDHLYEHLIEMGRRYNHFIFCITEDIITKAQSQGLLNNDTLVLATSQFITDLEKQIHKENPLVFSFFLNYREKAKEAKNKS